MSVSRGIPSRGESLAAAQRAAGVPGALDLLDEPSRALLLLAYRHGMSDSEIGSRVGADAALVGALRQTQLDQLVTMTDAGSRGAVIAWLEFAPGLAAGPAVTTALAVAPLRPEPRQDVWRETKLLLALVAVALVLYSAASLDPSSRQPLPADRAPEAATIAVAPGQARHRAPRAAPSRPEHRARVAPASRPAIAVADRGPAASVPASAPPAPAPPATAVRPARLVVERVRAPQPPRDGGRSVARHAHPPPRPAPPHPPPPHPSAPPVPQPAAPPPPPPPPQQEVARGQRQPGSQPCGHSSEHDLGRGEGHGGPPPWSRGAGHPHDGEGSRGRD